MQKKTSGDARWKEYPTVRGVFFDIKTDKEVRALLVLHKVPVREVVINPEHVLNKRTIQTWDMDAVRALRAVYEINTARRKSEADNAYFEEFVI